MRAHSRQSRQLNKAQPPCRHPCRHPGACDANALPSGTAPTPSASPPPGIRYVTESVYVKYAPPSGIAAADVLVTLTVTNAAGVAKAFQLMEGGSWFLCGSGYFGLCKDVYGAMAYEVNFARAGHCPPPAIRLLLLLPPSFLR
eukprot:scaffold8006_cov113-Isochrysis_galbana.AAC.1